jgi:hypothetical protein
MKICRYGFKGGSTTTNIGTLYEEISLPYKKESMPYYEFIVIGKCMVKCSVLKGKATPGFEQKGGGVQYVHINDAGEKNQHSDLYCKRNIKGGHIMAREIRNISTDIMQGFSKKYLNAMEATFEKYGVWKCMFSIGKVADESTCMIYDINNGKWEIFFSERNNKIEPESFEDDHISDACLEMIRRVPEEKDCVEEMQDYYRSLLEKNPTLGFGSKDIEKIIKKILPAVSVL